MWQSDGARAEVEGWDRGCPDPSLHNTRDCAGLVAIPLRDTTALYRDMDCLAGEPGLPIAPICQRGGQTTTLPPTTTTPLPDCPSGWETYEDSGIRRKCFKLIQTDYEPSRAENYCQDQGGHLASVHSLTEHNFIWTSFRSAITSHGVDVYIGGYYDGGWKWKDGTSFDFSYWDSGYPSHNNDYNFAAIDDDLSTGRWNDQNSGGLYSICQLTYETTSTPTLPPTTTTDPQCKFKFLAS